jgi:hypothetical protein
MVRLLQDQWVLIMIISQDFFLGDEGICFDDVKTMIFRRLRLLERQHFVSIRARYNTESVSAYYFCLIPVRDEVEWRMVFQMASVGMNWRIIELYVEVFFK